MRDRALGGGLAAQQPNLHSRRNVFPAQGRISWSVVMGEVRQGHTRILLLSQIWINDLFWGIVDLADQ